MQPLQKKIISNEEDFSMLEIAITGTTQCVGFARHWLENNLGLTFCDVKNAIDIWHAITQYKKLSNSNSLPVTNRINGCNHQPEYGDLIIYKKHLNNAGHVAVIIAINHNTKTLSVTEQNYMNCYQTDNKQRQIPYLETTNSFLLQDKNIVGWKHLNAHKTIT